MNRSTRAISNTTLAPSMLLCLAVACTPESPAAEEGSSATPNETDTSTETSSGTDTEGETDTDPDPDMMPDEPTCTEYSELEIAWNDASSVPRVVRGEDLRFTAEDCEQADFDEAGQLEDAALAVVEALRPLYGLSSEHSFELLSLQSDKLGFTHIRLTHRYEGVVVSGSQLIVHFDTNDRAYELNGHLHPVANVNVTPSLSAAEAEAAAQQDFGQAYPGEIGQAITPQLVVWIGSTGARLAFAFDMSANELLRRKYAVDAQDGSLLIARNAAMAGLGDEPGVPAMITGQRIAGEGGGDVEITGWRADMSGDHHLYNDALGLSVHDSINCSDIPSDCINQPTNMWGASDPVALSAFANVHSAVDYFRTVHTRPVSRAPRMMVRFPNDCNGPVSPNAFFVPGFSFDLLIATLPGNGISDLTTADILGHEYTHAVVQASAGLVYQSESGALNESFADIFGVEIEFATQEDNAASYPQMSPGTADWFVGEDIGFALRDVRDPSTRGQPTRYAGTNWADPNPDEFTSANDYGGVHRNSGVQNQFFYFLSEGGAGNNDGLDYDLTGIGRADASQIGYRALTVYAGPDSDYADLRQAWRSAAMDLDAQQLAAVEAAWEAVGVGACPTWFADIDTDGFGDPDNSMEACEQPPGYIEIGGDCNDMNADSFPGAAEVCSDGVVNDCTLVFCAIDPDAPGCVEVEAFCGATTLTPVMGQIEVTWASDCLLQTSADLQNWADYGGQVDLVGCERAASFDANGQLFFRLRTP